MDHTAPVGEDMFSTLLFLGVTLLLVPGAALYYAKERKQLWMALALPALMLGALIYNLGHNIYDWQDFRITAGQIISFRGLTSSQHKLSDLERWQLQEVSAELFSPRPGGPARLDLQLLLYFRTAAPQNLFGNPWGETNQAELRINYEIKDAGPDFADLKQLCNQLLGEERYHDPHAERRRQIQEEIVKPIIDEMNQ